MKRGPRPNPALRLVKGDSRASLLTVKSPASRRGAPSPPDFLDRGARKEWRRVASELYRAGLLTPLDHAALAAYCQAHSLWVTAQDAIAKMSEMDPVTGALLIKTSNGNAIQNPLIGIANRAKADAVRYAAEFFMTPDSRGRVAVPGIGVNDPADEFFK